MQQARDLLDVIRLLRRPEISIGMYSGYTKIELDSGRFWTWCGLQQEARRQVWADTKPYLDFAVFRRFVALRPSRLPVRTSANQALQLFSGRYREEHFKPLEFEVHIEPEGLVHITGFPLSGLPV